MYDREFLIWIYNRLINVYNEKPNIDYMLKLCSIINKIDSQQITPNCDWTIK